MTDKAYAVPLHELLASVPREARLVIDDDDGMGTRFIPVGRYCNEAAEALRARLAQPEQEVVFAFRRKGLDDFCTCSEDRYNELAQKPSLFEVKKFYTAPPQREWQGLTEQDVLQIRAEWEVRDYRLSELCRAIEAKLKEKNT